MRPTLNEKLGSNIGRSTVGRRTQIVSQGMRRIGLATQATLVYLSQPIQCIWIAGSSSDLEPLLGLAKVGYACNLAVVVQAAGIGGTLGATRRRPHVPLERRVNVASYTGAVLVADAEVVLAVGVSERRCALVQLGGRSMIRRYAGALGVLERKVV